MYQARRGASTRRGVRIGAGAAPITLTLLESFLKSGARGKSSMLHVRAYVYVHVQRSSRRE